MALTFGTSVISWLIISVGLISDEFEFGSQLIYAIFDDVIESGE